MLKTVKSLEAPWSGSKALVDAGTPNILPLRNFLTEEAGHRLIVDFCRHGDFRCLAETLGRKTWRDT